MLRSESPAAAGRESPAKQGVNVNFRAQREIFIIACAIVFALLFAFPFVFFIGPRSDHSLPMSVTHSLTDSLTHDLVED